jgi:creatinine amidohydrolase
VRPLHAVLVAALIFVRPAADPQAIPTPTDVAPSLRAADDPPRPIGALDTVFLEDMTWMEVRDALKAGKTTAIVATGGVEQNGPYLATGKHNLVLRATTDAIARKLGNALVAPIVPFVPEGDIDPPTGHMKYPGTISVSEDTYQRLVTDIVSSLRTHGFTNIVLIGDSGGNQDGMERVAKVLNARWAGGKTRVHFIPEYYDHDEVERWLETQGITQVSEGYHDDFALTATIMTVDPKAVRMDQRIAAGKFRINGIDLAPAAKTIEWGRKIVDFRARATVDAIQRSFARTK